MQKDTIINISGLGKRFGRIKALDCLSFEISKGEIFGILGPNGAGKSTFISVLTTILKPDSGDISINGFSVKTQPEKVKRFIGYVPQEIALYPMLSGIDNLSFWAGIYGIRGELKKERIQEALRITCLEDRAKDRVDGYSGGMKRRLNIAAAMLHKPEILVMDEPTVGVDIQSRRYILDSVDRIRQDGRTVVFASHYIDEMEEMCDRLAIIDQGRIKAIGSAEELKLLYGKKSIEDIMLDLLG